MKTRLNVSMTVVCLVLVLGISVPTMAKEKKLTKKDVPAAVITAFEKAYPKAKVKGYSTETEKGNTIYEVESFLGKLTLDVSYLPDGTAAEIEEGMAAKDLPSAVQDAVHAKYPKGKVTKAEKKTVGSEVTYELSVRIGKTHAGLEVDASGKILDRSKAGGEEEEND